MDNEAEQQFVDTATRQFGWDEQFARAFDYARDTDYRDKRRPRGIDVARRVMALGLDRDRHCIRARARARRRPATR